MRKWRKPYDHEWARLSARVLRVNPICEMPGCRAPSAHVDHIEPVRLAPHRRLDRGNLQALCHACHNRITAAYERGSLAGACDDDGLPLDPGHPWRQIGNEAAIVVANAKPKVSPWVAAKLKQRISRRKG